MDILLKQRMVGAIVLISLGVIFIPMLLSGKGDLLQGDKSNIPPVPRYEIKKAEIPPPVIDSKQDVLDKLSTTSTSDPEASPAETPDLSKTLMSAGAPPSGASADATDKPAATADAKQGNDAAAKSTPTKTVPAVTTTKETVPDKAASKNTPTATVSDKKPASSSTSSGVSKPVEEDETTSPHPITGWVVQIGSFESRENATQLSDKLRAAGFTSFIEPRKGKTTVYRVRVGPEKRRSQAEKLQKELLAKQKIKGMIMHFPD